MTPKGREETTGINISDEAFDEPPNKLNLPKAYLSISQVMMYLRCAMQYKFRYIDDHKRPPAIPMALGSSGHAALEATHHHIVDHDVPAPTEQLLDAFADKWTELSALVEDWEGAKPGPLKDMGIALVRLYNQQVAPTVKPQVTDDGVRGIEKRFDIDVAGVPMMGFIDLIDVNAAVAFSETELALMKDAGHEVPEDLRSAVVDFKFKAKSMTQAEVDGSPQMTLYSLATGIYVVRFEQLLKTKTPKVKRAQSIRSRADYLWLQQIVRGVAEAITKGVFPPTDPTAWVCSPKWCGFWDQCRGKRS